VESGTSREEAAEKVSSHNKTKIVNIRVWIPVSHILPVCSSCVPELPGRIYLHLASEAYFSATMTAAAKLPAHVVAQASKSSPNLLREIFYGIGLGIFGEGLKPDFPSFLSVLVPCSVLIFFCLNSSLLL